MSPTKPFAPAELRGQGLRDAQVAMAGTPRGGVESGFDGSSKVGIGQALTTQQTEPAEPQSPFAGLGPLLEDDAATTFKQVDQLVKRQETLAISNLAEDTYWAAHKLGNPWYTLTRDDSGVSHVRKPTGIDAQRIQPVPNLMWDLCNKATETLWVDPPKPKSRQLRDTDDAKQAAELFDRILTENAGENGLNEVQRFYDATDKALTNRTAYLHYWVDPAMGGYAPHQIQAHPEATDPNNPLVGPDGMPTTEYVLRYVTPDGQFTEDASQAAPEWIPKLRCDLLGREHVRVYPETAKIEDAEKVVLLWYCTLGEARRRWEPVRNLATEDAAALCDWTPARPLPLLPPAQRARWKLTTGGRDTDRGGSGDERICFFYIVYQRGLPPDYQKGAAVVISGYDGGFILNRDTLAADIEMPAAGGKPATTEPRCFEIPLVAITPRADADERSPQGRSFVEMFGGASEFNAALAQGYLEVLDIITHLEKYTQATSPVEGWQVEESRRTGKSIPILRGEQDKVQYGQAPPDPGANLVNMLNWGQTRIESIASLPKPLVGASNQQEVSGVARRIAVQQGLIGLNRMQLGAVVTPVPRSWRIQLELMQKFFTTPQRLRYIGPDGAPKEKLWRGSDLALVGSVGIKPGTGTMLSPDAKIAFIAQVKGYELMDPDTAVEAARSAFAEPLGLPDDPHEQYAERCADAWKQGPPDGWLEQFQQYQLAMQAFQQQMAAMQAEYSQVAAQAQATGQQPPSPPQPASPPPQPPWNPFAPRVNDQEPPIAAMWRRKLSGIISTTTYSTQPAPWRQLLDAKYTQAAQIESAAQQAAMQAQQGNGGQSGPPSYQQFLSAVQQKVVQTAESIVAREVAAMGAAGVVQEKAGPMPTLAAAQPQGTQGTQAGPQRPATTASAPPKQGEGPPGPMTPANRGQPLPPPIPHS